MPGDAPSIRLLVVDDNDCIRRQMRTVLALEPGLDVVCESADGFDAIRKAQEFQPDVVLLDITLPQMNGLQAAPLIKKFAPKAEILFVTLHDNPFFVREAFTAGGRGFLTKSEVPLQLGTAVRAVHNKEKFVSKDLIPAVMENAVAATAQKRGES